MSRVKEPTYEYGYYLTIAKTLITDHDCRNALDLGCNHGLLVKGFLNMGLEAYGCDISADALTNSPAEIKDYLILLDITKDKLPFENDKFEIVTMLDVVEHLNSFNWTISELKRVLKRGGVVYISTPSPFTNLRCNDPTHINIHPKRYWIDLFTKHGFSYLGEFPKKQRKRALAFLKRSKTTILFYNIFSLFNSNPRSDLLFQK